MNQPDAVVEATSEIGQFDSPAPSLRPLRADARRNRDALLAAGGAVFAERGAEASLEEVARRAGVGIGTLYRHFPTRDALTAAVYRHELDQLCDPVEDLLRDNPPDVALARWMHNFVAYVPTKRGMSGALKAMLGPDNELFAYSRQRIHDAIAMLLAAGIRAEVIRADVEPDDLMRALSGVCMAGDSPGWQEQAGRVVDLLVDGLRHRAPQPV